MSEVVGLRGFRDEVYSGKPLRFTLDLGTQTTAYCGSHDIGNQLVFDTASVSFCPNLVVLSNNQGDMFVIRSIDSVELERGNGHAYDLWCFICSPLGVDIPLRYVVRSYQGKKFAQNY